MLSEELGKRTGHEKLYRMSKRMEETVKEVKGLNPNVDFYSASTYYSLGIPIDLFTPDLRREPHVRLDRPRAGAVPQQPPDPAARRVQRQPRRPDLDSDGGSLKWTNERTIANRQTTKPAILNCPYCRSAETYELRWVVRKKKDRLPRAPTSATAPRFQKAQSYMVLLDDKVACKNLRCRKRFDISGIKTMAFL